MQGKIQWTRLVKKLSPYTIQKGLRYLKHFGPREFWIRLHERFEPEEIPYAPWFAAHQASEETLEKQRKTHWKNAPLISVIVPVYKPKALYAAQMLDSLLAQSYQTWEACLVNAAPEEQSVAKILSDYAKKDSRIRVRNLETNLGIAGNTNEAISMAKGAWMAFLDHDDLLAPDALFELASCALAHPDVRLIYTDEDKVTPDLAEYYQPHFKPELNLDLLRSNNYICHLLAVRSDLQKEAGLLDPAFNGAQDYDFIFRCVEKAGQTARIPRILYHWRTHPSSTSDNPASKLYAYEAGKKAIEAHLARCGVKGTVEHTKDYGFYRVHYPVQGTPLVSIIIPNKDLAPDLAACIASIREKSTWDRYEILIVENNSQTSEIFALYQELEKDPKIRLLTYEKPFNYSAINNLAARSAQGDYLLFLNNDVTVLTPEWMEEMLGLCQREDVGAVGVKLLYPEGTIQHAGIVVGMGGVAGSMFVDMPQERSGYLHKASLLQDLSAVTAACMMVRKEVFWQVGGFTEALAVAFNDVDLCLKMNQAGYRVVYHPYVRMIHAESRTRGAENTEEKVRRFQDEIEYMRSHWIRILRDGDPNYNPNLSLTKWNYSLRS